MDCEVADQVSMEQLEAEQSASPKRKAAPLAFDEELNTVIMSSELTAKYFGVSQQTLSNWVRAGCPRYKYGFYDLKEVSEYRFTCPTGWCNVDRIMSSTAITGWDLSPLRLRHTECRSCAKESSYNLGGSR